MINLTLCFYLQVYWATSSLALVQLEYQLLGGQILGRLLGRLLVGGLFLCPGGVSRSGPLTVQVEIFRSGGWPMVAWFF